MIGDEKVASSPMSLVCEVRELFSRELPAPRPEWCQRGSHVKLQKEIIPGGGNSKYKGPEEEMSLA